MRYICQRCRKNLDWDDDGNYWSANGYCSQDCYFSVYPELKVGNSGIFVIAIERPDGYEFITHLNVVCPLILNKSMLLMMAIEDVVQFDFIIPSFFVYREICPIYSDYKTVAIEALTKFDQTQFSNWCLAKKFTASTP